MKREEIAFWLDLKALVEHAIFHQQTGSRMNMRFALNHAHQAVELTLRKKAELLGKNPYDFPAIVKALKRENVNIPYERQIDELNKARALTQHYGTTPNDDDTRRLVFVARDFLGDFWRAHFNINYDDISLVDLLGNDEIREVLRKAEKANKSNDYEECVTQSVLSIYLVKWWIESGFHEEKLVVSGPSLIDTVDDHNVSDALGFVLDIALSSPFAYQLKKLRKSTGIVFLHTIGGKPIMQKLKTREFTRQDALVALELAIEYALWAEQIYS